MHFFQKFFMNLCSIRKSNQINFISPFFPENLGEILCTDLDEGSFDPTCTLVEADTSLFEVVNSYSGTANQGKCDLNTKKATTYGQADEYGQFDFYIEVTDTTLNTVQHTSTIAVVIKVGKLSQEV